MKKYHDEVIRNIYHLNQKDPSYFTAKPIYDVLLTSSALPASYYTEGFKNLNHLIEVIHNEQNATIVDLEYIFKALYNTLTTKYTYKQLRTPKVFYDYLVTKLIDLNVGLRSFTSTSGPSVIDLEQTAELLSCIIEELKATYGWEVQRAALDKYTDEHPELKAPSDNYQWYDQENSSPVYIDAWKKYFAFRKTIRFGAFYKFWSVFESLLKQVKICITYLEENHED